MIEEIGGDRLRHHSTPRGDLVEVQVLEAMFEEQRGVPILQLATDLGLDEVDQIPVEDQCRGDEQMLLAPSRSHRCRRKVRQGIHAERVDERLSGGKVGAQVGEHLSQRGLRVLCAIDGAEPALAVVEAALRDSAFIVADRPCIADIALFAYIHNCAQGRFSLENYPAIRSWIARIEALPRFFPMSKQFAQFDYR